MPTIAGRYDVISTLGQGGMGVVYRARDTSPLDREVAVKTLHHFSDPIARDLFYRECQALKSISHPNIVEIFDMGEFDDDGERKPYFVMPLLSGHTLHELIRNASHRLTVDRVVEIVAQTCRGLQAAHDCGLVHRDIKPSNIFVLADDSVKLIDFGVAHAVQLHSRTSGFDKGTLLYMAPEQVQHKPVSVQSDIYSLSVTMYEALTRRHPFQAATEEAVVRAIVSEIPPPAFELNPTVSQTLSRVIHKGMAKQPWNRFDSAREFSETLLKALRNEPIALFDPGRIKPRVQTAARALEKGDHQFASEIVGEMEAEGHLDPELSLLRTQIDQVVRQKTLAQLLDSARARFEEGEDPLALQKLHELLKLDPANVAALGLRSRIEDRRSERQVEKWLQLAREHVYNHSYSHAQDAVRNALNLRPRDSRAVKLQKEIESEQAEYVRLREEKAELYRVAVNAWKNGDVSRAFSQMKHVIELDRLAPDTASPDAGGLYQTFYDRVRSEHDGLQRSYAEAKRLFGDGEYGRAVALCNDLLTKYPGQPLFQALKFDIDETRRQQLSAVIADVGRRIDEEIDLDAKVSLLREVAAQYPDEPHFARLLKTFDDKRELVNSIVERAKLHEAAGEIAEAIADLDTLQAIHMAHPGLAFERERLVRVLEQQARAAARSSWERQIRQQLDAGSAAQALELVEKAVAECGDDGAFEALRRESEAGVERRSRASVMLAEGETLCKEGRFAEGIEVLREALDLDDRIAIRTALRDALVHRAVALLDTDFSTAEWLAESALEIDPGNASANSVREQAVDRRRERLIDECLAKAHSWHEQGQAAVATQALREAVSAHGSDPRLESLLQELSSATVVLDAPTEYGLADDSGDVPLGHQPASDDRGGVPGLAGVESSDWMAAEPTHGSEPETLIIPLQVRATGHGNGLTVAAAPGGLGASPATAATASERPPAEVPMTVPETVARKRWRAGAAGALGAGLLVMAWWMFAGLGRDPAVTVPPDGAGIAAPASTPAPAPLGGPAEEPSASAPPLAEAPATPARRLSPSVTPSTGGLPLQAPTRPDSPPTARTPAAPVAEAQVPPQELAQSLATTTPGTVDQIAPEAQVVALQRQLALAGSLEAGRNWASALALYRTIRTEHPERAAETDAAIGRVQGLMRSDGLEAFRRARQYDALGRAEDAISWYQRALSNFAEDEAEAASARERIGALRGRR